MDRSAEMRGDLTKKLKKNAFRKGIFYVHSGGVFMWLAYYFNGWMPEVLDAVCIALATGIYLLPVLPAFFLREKGLFWVAALALEGGEGLYLLFTRARLFQFAFCFFSSALMLALSGFTLFVCFALRAECEKRLLKKEERLKKVQYLLPSQENPCFARRLRASVGEEWGEEKDWKGEKLPLSPIREMLVKIKASPWSPAELLEVNDMDKSLALYALKSAWNVEEYSAVNEMFARLLKLSAKYAV